MRGRGAERAVADARPDAHHAAQLPQQSPAILEALESGSVAISRAYFDVASGVVQWDF